ncbi:DUF4835 family protein [candidate division KSB1 bacterium]|nr:DUF4835 family protein [candidate division KSB1 bacterium]
MSSKNYHGNQVSCVCRFCILFALILCLTGLQSLVYSQRLVSKVTVVLENLPELKQEELKDFNKTIEDYINSTTWISDDQGGEIKLSMQFLLSDISSSAESRYRATILASNDKEVQYFDKRCLFAYQMGETLYFNENNPTSLTALIDFYVYLILGNEFDKYSKFGGTPFFERAKRCAAQGKFGLGRFIEGWDLREKLILKILGDEYKKFREMKDDFFLGIYLFDEEGEKSKGRRSIYDALVKIEKILLSDPENEDCKRFIGAYSSRFVDVFKDMKDKSVFEKLIKLDPERKALYEKYLK